MPAKVQAKALIRYSFLPLYGNSFAYLFSSPQLRFECDKLDTNLFSERYSDNAGMRDISRTLKRPQSCTAAESAVSKFMRRIGLCVSVQHDAQAT